jgi:hypothetical protein
MENQEIQSKLIAAIEQLLCVDPYLLQNNLSERSITHKLGEYLQQKFPDHNVDCEYNKFQQPGENGKLSYTTKCLGIDNNELSKKLQDKYAKRIAELKLDSLLSLSIYPDIIVHTRGYEGVNVLVVEVKKAHGDDDELDILKLKSLTNSSGSNPYKYQLGAAITIKTNKDNVDVKDFKIEFPTLRWFENGNEVA